MEKVICNECRTTFTYSEKDIKVKVLADGKEHKYVICPSCEGMIFID